MNITRAAVIGAGTMGSGIAGLLAEAGIDTLLLDIPASATNPYDPPVQRSAAAYAGKERLIAAITPADTAGILDRIQPGNTEDDWERLAEVDWVIEVIVERLEVKQALMARLAVITRPDTIISTNTSGLRLGDIAAGLPDSFTRRFIGTHFFNPPRQLHLLELIPHAGTAPEVVVTMRAFASEVLGKGVVVCRDTPNFIGNRFYTMLSAQLIGAALDQQFTIAEVDSLTGVLIGRPKTATFRLQDLVGIDVAAQIMRNLYPAIPDDPARAVLQHAGVGQLFDQMIARGRLGNKSGQGFYKTIKAEDGSKQFWTLDLDTFAYSLPPAPTFESVTKHAGIGSTAERIRAILAEDDRAARYLRQHFAFFLTYASHRVPEITESILNIDRALTWGFGHELGAFALWDALGVAQMTQQFEASGYPVANWVRTMLDSGEENFYRRDSRGEIVACFDPVSSSLIDIPDLK
jgi:3-hydroxyacyl-CoA dehydrogenase